MFFSMFGVGPGRRARCPRTSVCRFLPPDRAVRVRVALGGSLVCGAGTPAAIGWRVLLGVQKRLRYGSASRACPRIFFKELWLWLVLLFPRRQYDLLLPINGLCGAFAAMG